jgi:hypothetical protein
MKYYFIDISKTDETVSNANFMGVFISFHAYICLLLGEK